MAKKYLLDASALYPLVLQLREGLLDYAEAFMVLDLTVYEVGNAIWKECQSGRVRDPRAVAKFFQEVFNAMTIRRDAPSVEDMLKLAVEEGITFYDASYLYTARSLGLKLVTEDRDLRKYPESINVKQLLEELKARLT